MTAEVIEGVVREIPGDEPDRRVVAYQPQQSVQVGLGAVALLSDEQFERNLELLKKGVERAKRMQQALLEEGTDFGKVPGVDRPFLHKPGAEKFEKAYGFAISYEIERKIGDGDRQPALEYIVHAKVHLGDTEGPVIAEGVGSCNTHESKYRFRQAKKACPECKNTGLIKGKADGRLKGKWWCPPDKGGCGKTFAPEDTRITEQVVGQVENENPHDLANTVLKMARKRAGVDAILTATGTSGLFTQDDDSPSVQQDAATRSQPAATAAQDGGEAAGQRASGMPAMPAMPKIPKGLTAETSLGEGDITGVIALGDGQLSDGNLRQTERGPLLGFRLTFADDKRIPQVLVPGELAEAIADAVEGDANRLAGLLAQVSGELFAVPWKNKDGEQMPPFYRLVVSSIKTSAWTLPAPEAKPKAASRSRSKPAAQSGAQEAAAAPADAAQPASGPGMTADEFRAGLKAQRIADAYAESAAQHMFGTPDIGSLTDQQRHALATEVGLFDQP